MWWIVELFVCFKYDKYGFSILVTFSHKETLMCMCSKWMNENIHWEYSWTQLMRTDFHARKGYLQYFFINTITWFFLLTNIEKWKGPCFYFFLIFTKMSIYRHLIFSTILTVMVDGLRMCKREGVSENML